MCGTNRNRVVKLQIVGDAFGVIEGIVEAQGFKGAVLQSLARLATSMARREGILGLVEAQFRAEVMAALVRAGYSPIVSVSALRWSRDEEGRLVEKTSSAEAPEGMRIKLQELEKLLEEKLRAVLEPWLQDRAPILLRIAKSGRGTTRAPAWIEIE